MPRKHRRNELAWWKQEIFVAAVVVTYLTLGFVAIQVWSSLSHHADAFAGSAMRVAR